MEIPEISIPEIYVPDVPEIYSPHYITITKFSGEYSMVTNLSCPKCYSFVEVYLPRDAYD